MAEPNYMAYAQYMGARNPMAEGMDQISGTLSDIQKRGVEREDRTRRNSLADLQMRRGEMEMQGAEAQLQDQQAQQGARQSLYGVNNPQDAYLAEMKATQEAAKKKQRAEMSAKHLDSIKTYKSLGMRPEFLTEYTKAEMMKDPELAPMAQYVSFADDTKMEITKPFKDGELRNPMNPQEFLPAGTYKVIGTATGNPEQPYQFNKIEPVEQKAEYKFREYNTGNTTVAEESQDGGRTWKKVSSAPRYKPASGGNGDMGDDVEAWGRAIQEGRANLQDVPNRGTVRSSVIKWVEKNGGADYAGSRAENSAYSSSLTQQQKQLGSMGSFVKNLNAQIDRVGQIGAELYTADARLMNVPIRKFRQMIAGSPQQSIYDMYITEIENEIGKLSTGSTASVAELSVGAQEKWAKIHDKNLSVNDMLKILKETKHAGDMRIKSVKEQIEDTRNDRKGRIGNKGGNPAPPKGKQDPLGIL